ncbi:MAG: hypothetical protein H7A51_00195 [Akkermansiaceae bacterium]|nr:hypothetical protein [Akkermansiaceae bacterium]
MKPSLLLCLSGIILGGIQLTHPPGSTIQSQPTPVNWPAEFDGEPLIRLDQTAFEKSFQRDFPGSIATFRCGGKQVILRHITTASRKLHPSSDCLRASGYHIGAMRIQTDDKNRQWAGYTAINPDNTYIVLERIIDTRGNTWTDVSSWYWHALIHPDRAPWLAQTVIQATPPI